jgi:hypothetical protein
MKIGIILFTRGPQWSFSGIGDKGLYSSARKYFEKSLMDFAIEINAQ